jgi:hypothetical protein
MKKALFFVGMCLFVFCSASFAADIPKLINYQGMLTANTGEPLDGTFNVFFRIYNAESGGDKRWEENHAALSVSQGLFNAILGSQSGGIDLDFSENYWLEVQVEGEIMPRIEFTSVGYAYRAMVADSASTVTPGSGSNWSVSNSVLYTNEYWGIARGGAWNVFIGDSARTHVNLGVACTTGGTWVHHDCYSTVSGGYGNAAAGRYATVSGGYKNSTTNFYAPTVGGCLCNLANNDYSTVGGGVDNRAEGSYSTIAGGNTNHTVYVGSTVGGGIANTASYFYATVPGGYENNAEGYGSFAAGYRAKAVHAGSFVWADTVYADFESDHDNEFAVRASGGMKVEADYSLYGCFFDNRTGGGDGIRAYANVSAGNVWGAVYAVNEGTSPAIYSLNTSGGLAAYLEGAVYIGDSLHVVGHLSKGSGSFKIDHPLDPENKYLYHSFVESPDMMNVYNGNVVLNAAGEARIDLPEWFEALNRDFRYQLTPVGQPGPNLHVAREISGNSYEIAGGEPGMKVSWQVTGIRQDPYAEKNRIPVEQDKGTGERGKYLHPEAYDLPETMGINYTDKKEKGF